MPIKAWSYNDNWNTNINKSETSQSTVYLFDNSNYFFEPVSGLKIHYANNELIIRYLPRKNVKQGSIFIILTLLFHFITKIQKISLHF